MHFDLAVMVELGKKIGNWRKMALGALTFILSAGVWSMVQAAPPPGPTTVPYLMTYTARLRSAGGGAVTTPQTVRFSLWTDADYDAGDSDGLGGINVLTPGYAGWQESHTVTPNIDGIYTVQLGSLTTLPNFVATTHLHLQVEVKPAASPATAFELLDPDGDWTNAVDRKPFNSAPYAINSDTVDNRDVGYGPGQLPFLDGFGKLDFSSLPGGVNQESWTVDNDNTIQTAGTGKIELKFGGTLNKVLSYDLDNSYFDFNDNVNIQGTLTVGGAPIGPANKTMVYEPLFADAVIDQSGGANRGKLEIKFVDDDGVPGNANFNHYLFTTRQNSLQNLDLILRVKVPDGFVNWQVNPLVLTYKTGDGNIANNRIDVVVEDTNGNPVVLSGASALANANWTTTAIGFGGAPSFVPGESFTVKLKLSAADIGQALVGKLKFNYFGS